MSKSKFMPDIELLTRDDWDRLRDARLLALSEAPDSFLATYAKEETYSEDRWLAEFGRGSWYVAVSNGDTIGLIGVTREPGMPHNECYLEYIWVAPKWRRSGFAAKMIGGVLDRLRTAGVHTAYLWVLNGNDRAMRLYRRLGFVSTNHRNWLKDRPGRSEEKMRKDLGLSPGKAPKGSTA